MLQSDFTKVKDFYIPQICNNMIDIMTLRALAILHLQILLSLVKCQAFEWSIATIQKTKFCVKDLFSTYEQTLLIYSDL